MRYIRILNNNNYPSATGQHLTIEIYWLLITNKHKTNNLNKNSILNTKIFLNNTIEKN